MFLDGNAAHQLGSIARDLAAVRGIGRCLDRVATLGSSVISHEGKIALQRLDLKPEMKKWNTVEKGIWSLRETAMMEMLYEKHWSHTYRHNIYIFITFHRKGPEF